MIQYGTKGAKEKERFKIHWVLNPFMKVLELDSSKLHMGMVVKNLGSKACLFGCESQLYHLMAL